MPHGEGPPVQRVILVCGHARRYFEPTKDGTYYCFECDDHKEVKERQQDPRSQPIGRTRGFVVRKDNNNG